MRRAKVRLFTWSIALAVSILPAPPALARDGTFAVSIPAGDLADILETLSAQTGISLVYDVRLPVVRTRPLQGRMSPREALDRLLQDTAVRAIRIGRRTFRVVARSRASHHNAPLPEPEAGMAPGEEIVVTARKFTETLSSVAGSIAVYTPRRYGRVRATSVHDVARDVEGLSATNGGPGRDRPFIRGMADSPFNGFSQSTVSVQVDEGRVTYDAAEPNLYLIDIARVEVLKGPQGPLYGTGALGGVYRVVTNRPVIGDVASAASMGGQLLGTGAAGGNAEAMLNLPLIGDRAAIRVVGYARSDGGWINDASGPTDVNRTRMSGGRAALRFASASGWVADVMGAYQATRVADSQYVDRGFRDLTRDVGQREPRRSSIGLAQSVATGPVGRLRLTIATSHSWQDQNDVFDASDAAAQLGVPGALRYRDRRIYRVFDQEVRLASAPGSSFNWTTGVSYLSAATRANGTVETASGSVPDYFDLHRRVTETAIFADGSYPLADRLDLAIGARLYRTTTEDERQEDTGARTSARGVIGFTPSASLSYHFAGDRLIYLRFGSAFRPGGIDPGNTRTGRYVGDSVQSIELGGRGTFDHGRLELAFAAFHTGWQHLQSDYLEANGLISTRNAGNAGITGIEATAAWRLPGGWNLRGGLTLQRPRLLNETQGRDQRLPVVPDVAGRFSVERSFRLFGTEVTPHAAVSYTGASRLSFDADLDRRMGSYALAQLGTTMRAGAWLLTFDIDNLFDARADSFAYGNPFSIRTRPQYTPLRPRTFSLSLSRRF